MKIMKINLFKVLILALSLLSTPTFSQSESDTTLLGLPGDNLNLYAVLDLFQKSTTIEEFEKTLNDEKTGINNLDLNLDDKVDFIKVKTEQKDKDFTFILQVDVKEKEIQDVAVILVAKDKNDKVTLQVVGDNDLYGKNYVIEPKAATESVTPNPAYSGTQPVPEKVVVVETVPVVQYVYSPVYVPYYPPYYYGYYPPYYAPYTVVSVHVYHSNTYYHHHGYYGGHNNNTVIIHNQNTYNNYHNNRSSSNTVNQNKASGNYNNASSNRPSTGATATPNSKSPTTNPSNSKASPTTNPSNSKTSPTTNPSNSKASPTSSPSKSNKSSTTKPKRNSPIKRH